MTTIQDSAYRPALGEKTRVRLLKRDHHEYSHLATILSALPNPSGRPENQWYDVQFDNGLYGRFMERYLEHAEGSSVGAERKEGGQVSAA